MWLTSDLELIKDVLADCRGLYPVAEYASISIPTYPCGQIGFVLASKNKVMIKESKREQGERERERVFIISLGHRHYFPLVTEYCVGGAYKNNL